jgi:hypothetical protein
LILKRFSNARETQVQPVGNGRDADALAEVRQLSQANRGRESYEHEQRLLALRNQAGIEQVQAAGPSPSHPEPDAAAVPQTVGLPEFRMQDVTPGVLRAAILRDGCLLIRGLIPKRTARRFAREIDRAFTERDRFDSGGRPDPRYFTPFEPDSRMGGSLVRHWVKNGGGLLAVDSPSLCFEMFELFAAAGLPQLVEGYLGEPILISAHKTTLRKAEPAVAGAWHQDGKFMGRVRALNLWLSLSDCGRDAPGLDLVPRRLEEFVTTQTDEAWLDNAISQRMAEQAAGEKPILRPVFKPGDALLFDDLFLHKTGSDPTMTKPRFAIENWFFGASGFPEDYAPIAV